MNTVVEQMLKKYHLNSLNDYENALKEIIQEIALLGLWRGKFFEVGGFYGGTALRILYGLDRFSEDMDFSLLRSNKTFDISKYETFVKSELESYGFTVDVKKKIKKNLSSIESAFIKANTLIHLIEINPNLKTDRNKTLKIKLEVDTEPPGGEKTEVVAHFNPIPYSVKTFTLPTLFAGKIAAALFRPYKFNVKGRDWYDFLWYVSRNTTINLDHLCSRMKQINKGPDFAELDLRYVKKMLRERMENLNLDIAIQDVLPFVKDHQAVEAWNKDLFYAAIERLR